MKNESSINYLLHDMKRVLYEEKKILSIFKLQSSTKSNMYWKFMCVCAYVCEQCETTPRRESIQSLLLFPYCTHPSYRFVYERMYRWMDVCISEYGSEKVFDRECSEATYLATGQEACILIHREWIIGRCFISDFAINLKYFQFCS